MMIDERSTQMTTDVREEVRERYAEAATNLSAGCGCGCDCESIGCCGEEATTLFGQGLYGADERASLPDNAVAASLGCGNPLAVVELREGETVLDLGSGGGIDVLLSARRVGPEGTVYGLDMTDEMLALAQANARAAGATNVHFLKGVIEDVPLPPTASTSSSRTASSTSRPRRTRCSPRSPACSGPAGESGSPTSSRRTT